MNEIEIKTLLQAKLAASPHGKGAEFVSELFIDEFSRRADLVMANGKLSAFEIKSSKDTLERLDGQIETYLKLFEQVTVVCAERHRMGVEARVPDGVGIWTLTEDGVFKVIRRAKTAKQVSHQSWLTFLPVDELRKLLAEHGLLRTGTRDVLIVRASYINVKYVRQYVLDFFKYRRAIRIAKLSIDRSMRVQPKVLPKIFSPSSPLMNNAPLRAIPRALI